VAGVYTIEFSSKTNTANAAMMGAGRTRRIAVSDTLLKSYTPDEVEVVIAHELGHVKNRDFACLLLFQSAVTLILFWLTGIIAGAMLTPLSFAGPGDAAGMPLLALILLALSLLFMPISNTYIRRRERAADDFALGLTGKPEAFVSMITRLTDQNLAEAEPGRWTERLFNDHPGYRSRVEHARRYEKPDVHDLKS
jgi:STE24 endopeptidase